MKYDDASWHYSAEEFPTNKQSIEATTHIGFFIKWCALNRAY